jgi:hypothetical protein
VGVILRVSDILTKDQISEVRFMSNDPGSDWFSAEHENLKNTASFYSAGSEEAVTPQTTWKLKPGATPGAVWSLDNS